MGQVSGSVGQCVGQYEYEYEHEYEYGHEHEHEYEYGYEYQCKCKCEVRGANECTTNTYSCTILTIPSPSALCAQRQIGGRYI